jgi:hypothetical protein
MCRASAVIRDLLGSTAPGGIARLAGVSAPGHELTLDIGRLNRTLVIDNEAVFGTVNANRRHYELVAVALADSDKSWLTQLITCECPLDQCNWAARAPPGDIKVIVDFAVSGVR